MSEFINTADIIGDDEMCDQIIMRTVTEYKENRVSTVGTRAFHGCTALTEVDLPNVTSIGVYPFNECTSLEVINMPSLITLGNSYNPAFSGLTNLKMIHLDNLEDTMSGNTNGAFSSCKVLTEICLPKAKNLCDAAFSNCTALKIVDLPSATRIGARPFNYISSVMALILRAPTVANLSLAEWGYSCGFCTSTGYIYVPSALVESYRTATNWSTSADRFRGIFKDEDVLQGIAYGTLVDLRSDTLVSVPIRGCYNYTNLETAYLPNVTSVGSYAFSECSSLKVADLGRISGELPQAAFSGCSNLVAVAIRSDSVPTLRWAGNDWATTFRYCNKLSGGDGYFYVPRALVDSYKAATNWSAYQFRALEDYTVDGTITGELDETKI